MYHEIEGQLSIEPIIFDDSELIARGKHYPYEEIESLEITSSQLFSPYGILTLRTKGRDIPIPFARSRKAKLELALRDFKKLQEGGGQDYANVIQDRPPAAMKRLPWSLKRPSEGAAMLLYWSAVSIFTPTLEPQLLPFISPRMYISPVGS